MDLRFEDFLEPFLDFLEPFLADLRERLRLAPPSNSSCSPAPLCDLRERLRDLERLRSSSR